MANLNANADNKFEEDDCVDHNAVKCLIPCDAYGLQW